MGAGLRGAIHEATRAHHRDRRVRAEEPQMGGANGHSGLTEEQGMHNRRTNSDAGTKPPGEPEAAGRQAWPCLGSPRPPRSARWLAAAALLFLAGCDNQAGAVFFQTAGAAARTVTDLVLTSYANLIAAVFAAF